MPNERPPEASDSFNPAFSPEGLRHAVRHGSRRTVVAQAASHVTSIVVLAALYHLVTPAEFGLIGMALPVVIFLRLFSSFGMNVATVQARSLSPQLVSAAFWLHLLLAFAMTAAAVAIAPLVAWFYDEPAARHVTTALAGTALVSALGLQHVSLLERNLRLGSAAVSRLAGQIAGGIVGIGLALAGYGVWALVVQLYVELAGLAVLAWYFEPWRPSRPSRGAPLADTLRFGGYYTAGQVVLHMLGNVDKILVGATLGPEVLGFYSQAFTVMMKPVVVMTAPLNSVMLPALSRSVHDRTAYSQILLAFQRLLAAVSFPAAVGLALVARDTMLVLGGPEWEPAGPLLSALSATILAQGFIILAANIFVSAGHWRAMLASLVVMLAVLSVGLLAGFAVGRHYGDAALGVACGYSLTTCLALFVPYMLFCLKLVDVSPVAWARQLVRPAVAAVAMGIVVFAVQQALMHIGVPPAVRLTVEVFVGMAAYGAFAWRELQWCVDRLRHIES